MGCQKIKNLLDVTFNVEYSVNLDATIEPAINLSQNAGLFSVNTTIDPYNDAEFSRYAQKIKEIQITSISAKILTINKPLTLYNASVVVFNGTRYTFWDFDNETLSVGKILDLGNNSNQWSTVQNILLDKNIFTILIDGETDVDDAEFTIEVTIISKIIANPLEN